MAKKGLVFSLVLVIGIGSLAHAVSFDASVVPLLKRAFFYGREYFVLRSGRTTMIVQADKVDLAPAFLYLLYDAENSRQSRHKDKAFNFAEGAGFVNSALEVVLGGFPFTAVGHRTETRRTTVDGIPAAEDVWFAGGIRVTERIFALSDKNAFVRRIELASVNLAGAEQVTLQLSLPPGVCQARDGLLIQKTPAIHLAIGVAGKDLAGPDAAKGVMQIGPLKLDVGGRVAVDTVLLTAISPEVQQEWPQQSPLAGLPAAIEETKRFWAAHSSVVTDDAVVRDIFDKARYGLPGMVADNGTMNAGIFEYGAQWVRDSSNTLLGMIHAGQFEPARAGFDHILTKMIGDDGRTMVANRFENPDLEQFDQMGELLHGLKAYRDWTGDDSLIRQHRAKLVALIERPLRPQFRDATGMVHNRREYWERTFDDAYELAYQTYVILGLREAAELAPSLGAEERAARWRAEADRMLQAMLSHPERALVEQGRLIKRRSTSGEWVKQVRWPGQPDTPGATERIQLAEPDATLALPIALGIVDPSSPLARKTLDKAEELWNARWTGGGHERYHSSSQGDQPGPWPFASCFLLRAEHEAGMFDRSRRTLEWLNTVQGGRVGAWFEDIPVVRSTAPTCAVLPWTSGEISLFVVRHLLGVRFEGNRLAVRPALYPDSPSVTADLRFRDGRLRLFISGTGPMEGARVNGRPFPIDRDGVLRLPENFGGGEIQITSKRP